MSCLINANYIYAKTLITSLQHLKPNLRKNENKSNKTWFREINFPKLKLPKLYVIIFYKKLRL